MKHLVLVAHGSRREASNEEVRKIAARLKALAGARYADVTAAFLELAEPSIPGAIQCCVERGAQEVVVLPYFLSQGRHVATDVPEQVQPKQAEHPQVRITIAPYLGAAEEGIAAILLQLAQ
jgi:sirohydrochlorin ferrochelatase